MEAEKQTDVVVEVEAMAQVVVNTGTILRFVLAHGSGFVSNLVQLVVAANGPHPRYNSRNMRYFMQPLLCGQR